MTCLYGQVKCDLISKSLLQVNDTNWKYPDYTFLRTIDSITFGKRVLVLSEMNHGYKTALDAQCMILKGLIDSGKINCVYIEASWISCDYIVRILREKKTMSRSETEEFLLTYRLRNWIENGFWEYLSQKIVDGVVTLRGLDIDGVAPSVVKNLFDEATRLDTVQKILPAGSSQFTMMRWYFATFSGWVQGSIMTPQSFREVNDFIGAVMSGHTQKNNTYQVKQWQGILDFFTWVYKRYEVTKENKIQNQIINEKQRTEFNAYRDKIMARVFMENYKQDEGSRIVCLTSSFHSLRKSVTIEEVEECCKPIGHKNMGEMLDPLIGTSIYSICFIAGTGEYGLSGNPIRVKKPIKGSLEMCLNKLNAGDCFINLEEPVLKKETFLMNAVFNKYLSSQWSNNFSGIFFIRKMGHL